NDDSFTQYLSPAREKGTKMLKVDNNLWIYSPNTDRVIRISGHMLRQSVMGSDMSYEDLMTDTEMQKDYTASILGKEIFNNRSCWKLELLANSPDLAYAKRIIWIDKERFISLKEELYGMSGTLLKKTEVQEVFQIEERWFPKRLTFQDVLKKGDGTEIIFEDIKFDVEIPKSRFSKASLRN
ncbi:MAG: outer membrane lipoprotein-sorting protein, partial [Candidatus Cloacimonadota bacterium]|nr:outer membrane lipoprotein-sorting protein [Candidatus Cloacimonadota bacterium]